MKDIIINITEVKCLIPRFTTTLINNIIVTSRFNCQTHDDTILSSRFFQKNNGKPFISLFDCERLRGYIQPTHTSVVNTFV